MASKTLAMRILDPHDIPYETRRYAVDLDHLEAIEVAQSLGLPAEQVWKTLVLESSSHHHLVAMVAGPDTVDLKRLARLCHEKWVRLIVVDDLKRLTGYVRGGVSPLGLKQAWPVWIDSQILQWERVSVSAGQRGVQIMVGPQDLIRITGAHCESLSL